MALLTITDNDAHMQHFLNRIASGHEQRLYKEDHFIKIET